MKKEGQACKNCIVKRKGYTEDFDEKKVYGSVYAACASTHCEECECENTADEITKKIKKFVKSKKIYVRQVFHIYTIYCCRNYFGHLQLGY